MRIAPVLAVLTLGALAVPAAAHHSIGGVYETGRTVSIEGRLTVVEIENPHSRFELEAKDGVWKIESRGVAGMTQRGFDRSAFKVGDQVVLEGSPARDRSKSLWLHKLTSARGRTFEAASR